MGWLTKMIKAAFRPWAKKRFEYECFVTSDQYGNISSWEINEYANDGWELVELIPQDSLKPDYRYGVFRREV